MRPDATSRFMLAGLLLLAAVPQSAPAHQFTVAFVAPFSGPEAARGTRALQGFLLATAERDGHAFETSDGHLGGVDSRVVKVDASRGTEFVVARLREIDAVEKPAFVTGLLPKAREASEGWVRATRGAVLVDPARSAVYQGATRPHDLRLMNGLSFAAAFRDTHRKSHDADAMSGYVAARLIDLAVRALRGDLARHEAVAAALEDATRQRW